MWVRVSETRYAGEGSAGVADGLDWDIGVGPLTGHDALHLDRDVLREDRREIERFDDVLGLGLRRTVMQLNHDARHALLPERHQHAPADDRLHARRDGVGERHIQRHG